MNQEHFKQEFAYMFQDPSGQQPISLFEIEAPDGWNHLLFNLLTIVAIIDKDRFVRIEQIKSKFGGLRFYFMWSAPDREPSLRDKIIDTINALPLQLSSKICKILGALGVKSLKKSWDPTHEQIYDIVSLFEEASFKVCETCGEPAKLRDNSHWLSTLCDKCYYANINEKEVLESLGEIVKNEQLLISGHLQPEDV